MSPHDSSHPLATALVALVASGALLFSGTPALAQSAHRAPASSVSAAHPASALGSVHSARSSASDGLNPGQELLAGQYIDSKESGGGYTFRMQDDGNAVTYDEVGHVVFATGTTGRGNRLVLQKDGNVVIYSAEDRPLWSTGTDDEPGAYLIIQSDGNLVLSRENDSPAWASSINGRIAEPPFSTLDSGEALYRGHWLTSPNGLFRAVMQRDGDLVGYGPNGVVWSTGTRGSDNRLEVTDDGYAVIYGGDGSIKWQADIEEAADSIALEDNGVLTILDEDETVVWDSQAALPGPTMYSPGYLDEDGLLRSDDGRYRAVMQSDGNFVVYGPDGAVWSTGTTGAGNGVELHENGVVDVLTEDGTPTWTATPAAGAVAPFHIVMQSDGNLVEYDAHDRAVWSSR